MKIYIASTLFLISYVICISFSVTPSHFLGKLVDNHLPQIYFSIGFLFLLKLLLEYFIFILCIFQRNISGKLILSDVIMQKSYETKQYKKGLKAADAILKKFPSHGGKSFLFS